MGRQVAIKLIAGSPDVYGLKADFIENKVFLGLHSQVRRAGLAATAGRHIGQLQRQEPLQGARKGLKP